ncbi:MAG TPA: divalent metal cation transporter [Bryobacteraceae bacterium]|nr:divalent metal cation transporter [Bryobacteraceae bacterium]
MQKIFRIALGITTSVGGFLDAGALASTAEAGAQFRFALLWALLIGTVCSIVLMEMAGRLAIVSGHALRDAMHERFGVTFSVPILTIGLVLDVLILGSEIGGASVALQLASGVSFQWWAIPVGVVAWLLIWTRSFGFIEKAVSFAGLITLAFVVSAVRVHPPITGIISGLLPGRPGHNGMTYWYTAVAIIGAIMSPYMFFFYSSGAIEDELREDALGLNRVVSTIGMGFGAIIAAGVLITAAVTLAPAGAQVKTYGDVARMLGPVFGSAGVPLFAACLGIASFGAGVEVSMGAAYAVAQVFGWNWSANSRPREEARFCTTYSVVIVLGTALVAAGLDPLKLTMFTMAATCLTLPAITFPFLSLMNDEHYVNRHTNGRLANITVIVVVAIAFVLALVSIPLQILGG